MTASEKGKELIEKFYKTTASDNRSYAFNDAIILHETRAPLKAIIRAKACALICVQMIIENIEGLERAFEGLEDVNLSVFSGTAYHTEFWQSVRAYIEGSK